LHEARVFPYGDVTKQVIKVSKISISLSIGALVSGSRVANVLKATPIFCRLRDAKIYLMDPSKEGSDGSSGGPVAWAAMLKWNKQHFNDSIFSKQIGYWYLVTFELRIMVWFRRLVTGYSPRRPGFIPTIIYVGFLVVKVPLGPVYT
jgi:hypothetical protein